MKYILSSLLPNVFFYKFTNMKKIIKTLNSIVVYLGVFSLLIGILFTFIGLSGAFDAIVAAGSISPSLLLGGLMVSFTSTIYGFIILIISIALKIIFLVTLEFM